MEKLNKEQDQNQKQVRTFKWWCNKIWNAGMGYILVVAITSITCLSMCNNYYLIQKDHCYKATEIGDSIEYTLSNHPSVENNSNYLSLWASTLAVVFVVFSIFGVLKLEITKKEIDEKLDKAKELEGNLDKLNKIQTAYQNYTVQIETSVNDNNIMRKIRLHNLVSILDDYEKNIEEERYNTVFELYMGILNMKTINESEHERYLRAEWILDRIDKGDYKSEQHLYLLGKCYYYKYKGKGVVKDLEHSLDAFCILCQEQNIYNHWQSHHYKYTMAQFNSEMYLYDLCQALYVYPDTSENHSDREYALDEASRLIENVVKS